MLISRCTHIILKLSVHCIYIYTSRYIKICICTMYNECAIVSAFCFFQLYSLFYRHPKNRFSQTPFLPIHFYWLGICSISPSNIVIIFNNSFISSPYFSYCPLLFYRQQKKQATKNSGLLGEKIRTLFPEINEERNTANIALNSQQTIIR